MSELSICLSVIMIFLFAVFYRKYSDTQMELEAKIFRLQESIEILHKKFESHETRINAVNNSLGMQKDTIKKMDKAIDEYMEAAHLARDGERLFNEGLQNILNYSEPIIKRGEGDK